MANIARRQGHHDARQDLNGFLEAFGREFTAGHLAALPAARAFAPPPAGSGAFMGAPAETLVNATVAGVQSDQTVTALASGGYVIAWTDASGTGGDASGTSIKAQVYNADGTRNGGEFLVNATVAGAQSEASIAALASGGFVVSWTDASATGGDTSGLAVRAQRFDANGARQGGEFLVNTATNANQSASSVTTLASGNFVVSWMDASGTAPDPNGTGIRAQLYSASGTKIGGEFLLNTTKAQSQTAPAIASLNSGGFVATWVDASKTGGDASVLSIKAQVFGANGAKVGSEFLVNTATNSTQDQVSVSSLTGGGFVVVWRDLSGVGDTSAAGVKAQVFDASGTKVGGEILVNTTEYNTQDQPSVSALAGGGFAVTWRDNSNLAADSSGFGVKVQVFDASGNAVGSEFQANLTTTGNQANPVVTTLGSGAIVVTWADGSGLDGDLDGGIKSRTFYPTAGAITGLTLSSTTISEAEVEHTTVATLQGVGAINAGYTYAIVDDSTGGGFGIVGNQLVIEDSLAFNYEASSSVTLTVRVTDTFGHSFDQVFTVALQDSPIEDRYVAGDELLANTTTAANQQGSSLSALSAGRFLLTWSDGSGIGGDASDYGIKAQIVDADGSKLGGEFLVNTQTLGSQDGSVSAGLSSGGFVIVWTDRSGIGGDASDSGIKAQLYDAAGTRVGGEFLVNQATLGAQKTPTVAALAGGGFVVSWADASGQGGDTSVSGVKAQIYDAAGARVGGEFLVNTNTANAQDTPDITALAGGGFVATWHDSSLIGGDTSKDAVKAQVYASDGTRIGTEFLVNTSTTGNQQQQTVAALSTGGFVVAWADASRIGGDPSAYGIKFQIYDADGAKVGGETLANTTTNGSQLSPEVAALSDGRFILSWGDYSGDGAENGTNGIKAQIFAGDGTAIGGEMLVNSEVRGNQVDPSVAGGADGNFVIAWTDYSGIGTDDAGTAVKFRVFDPLAPQGGPPQLVANPDSVAGAQDQEITILASTLLANDNDVNGLPITLSGVTAVSGGTVALDADGNVVFTPFAGFHGSALFTYSVGDTAGNTATGRVTVNVVGQNHAPVAQGDAVNVGEDGTSFAASLLLANDSDPDAGDTLHVAGVGPTTAGGASIALSNGSIVFAPGTLYQQLAAGQTATDSFTYSAVDQGGLSSTATVTLTVVGANDAPYDLSLAGNRVDENAANGTVVGTVGAKDVDQGDTLTYSLTNSAGGRFTINAQTGVVSVANGTLLDYEAAATQTIAVRATDASGAFVESSYTILLNNLPEPRSYVGDNGANVFVAPTNDLWTIDGLSGNDKLTGNASADVIYGRAGVDTLDGAGGADTLYGGIGDDTYYVDNVGDVVVENYGEGNDQVLASVNFTLSAYVENATQTGTGDVSLTGNDLANTINGNAGANLIKGGVGGDLLVGNDGADTLLGEAGNDYLLGGNGADVLNGGAGTDELSGGAGADTFVFDSLVSSAERDKVKDFAPGEDKLQFSSAVFTALAPGALSPSAFTTGFVATTADHHIVYQATTGMLFYDPDGAGGVDQIQIALFGTKPALTAADIIVA